MREQSIPNQIIGGVDEAGRGPVLGPLVVACVMVEAEHEDALVAIGVKDSKALTARQRDEKAAAIRAMASRTIGTSILSAEALDHQRATRSLNDIEAELFANAIIKCLDTVPQLNSARSLASDRQATVRVYVDAADVDPAHFSKRIAFYLGDAFPLEIVSEHKADATYPVVASASIIAKTLRDAMIEEISAELNMDIGSGYPSDSRTIRFIKAWLKTNNALPPHTRKSWETAKRLLVDHKYQPTTLEDFMN